MSNMKFYLMQRQKKHALPFTIDLDEEETIIGRQPNAYLATFPQISRKHASFQQTPDGKWYVKDLSSLNGTFVNGTKIGKGLHPVNLGDIVGLGISDMQEIEGFVCILCAYPSQIKQEGASVSDENDFENPFDSVVSRGGKSNDFFVQLKKSNFCTIPNQQQNTSNNASSSSRVATSISSKSKDFQIKKLEHMNILDQFNSSKSISPSQTNSPKKNYSSSNENETSLQTNYHTKFSSLSHTHKVSKPISPLQTHSHSKFSREIEGIDLNPIQPNLNSSPLKECRVKLGIKCDSPYFPWPYDIKKPKNCFEKSITHVKKKRRKRLIVISSSDESMSDNENKREQIVYKYAPASTSKEILPFRSPFSTIDIKPEVSKSLVLPDSCVQMDVASDYDSEKERINQELSVEKTIIKATVKPMMQSKLYEYDDLGFSQKEEVITISDDNDYLDFNSSQMPLYHIKSECEDSDSSDFDYHACEDKAPSAMLEDNLVKPKPNAVNINVKFLGIDNDNEQESVSKYLQGSKSELKHIKEHVKAKHTNFDTCANPYEEDSDIENTYSKVETIITKSDKKPDQIAQNKLSIQHKCSFEENEIQKSLWDKKLDKSESKEFSPDLNQTETIQQKEYTRQSKHFNVPVKSWDTDIHEYFPVLSETFAEGLESSEVETLKIMHESKSIVKETEISLNNKGTDSVDDGYSKDINDPLPAQKFEKYKAKAPKGKGILFTEPKPMVYHPKKKRVDFAFEQSDLNQTETIEQKEFTRQSKDFNVPAKSCDTDNQEFFPVLSENFEEHLESNEELSKIMPQSKCKVKKTDISLNNKVIDSGDGGYNKDIDNPLSAQNIEKYRSKAAQVKKIVLTEPKPMLYRPRMKRGREEWFTEQNEPEQNDKAVSQSPSKKQKALPKTRKNLSTKTQKCKPSIAIKKPAVPKKSLKEEVKKKIGYRIPKIKRITSSPKPERYSPNKSLPRKEERKPSPSIQKPLYESESMRCERTKAPVKKRPENFGSRMNFLLDQNIINKSATRTKKEVSRKSSNEKHFSRLPSTNPGGNYETNRCKTDKVEKNALDQSPREHQNISVVRKHINLNLPSQLCRDIPISNYDHLNNHQNRLIAVTNNNSHSHTANSNYLSHVKDRNISSNYCMAPKPVAVSTVATTAKLPIEASQFKTSAAFNTYKKGGVIRDPRLRKPHSFDQINICSTDKGSPPQAIIPPFVGSSTKLSFKMNFNYMLSKIVSWNPSWLKEQTLISKPPPEVSKGVAQLPLSYDSLDMYAKGFFPMILLEMWDKLFQEYKAICQDEKPVRNRFYVVVNSCSINGDLMNIHCESVVNPSVSYNPRDGEVAIFDLKEKNTNKIISVFGYISAAKTEYMQNLNPKWHCLPKSWLQDAEILKFTFQTKKKSLVIDIGSCTKAHVLSYVKNKLRLADGIQNLSQSRLAQDILRPHEQTFDISKPNSNRSKAFSLGSFNSDQTDIILSINEDIRQTYSEPRICMIQGPPGTGKTHTIVGILQHLLSDNSNKMKVLVTAPSNAAVDVIGRRLVNLKHSRELRNLKLVRVGINKQIHSEMLPYSLDELASKIREKRHNSQGKCDEQNILDLRAEIDTLLLEISKLGPEQENVRKVKESRLRQCQQRQKQLSKYLETNKRENKRKTYLEDKNCKINVLRESDVVLSTLSSCRQSLLENIYGKDDMQFSCCIIDEATQCTEPDILQPLMFGMHKLVLIGDHQQLPATVNSQLATECNFDRSLYERFHLYFLKHFNKSPIHRLTEQFRMHSQICSFPSSHFYNGMLSTFPGTDIKYESFPLKPYIVFDVLCGQESNSRSSKTNVTEALVIAEICKHLLDCIPLNCSAGIITPYQGQRDLYTRALSQNQNYKRIEVNTVDGFQGREKDVIILSCVRANSPSGAIGFLACKRRLNVAITRAKRCLIICGHMKSLQNDSEWATLIDDARSRNVYMSVFSPEDVRFLMNNISKSI